MKKLILGVAASATLLAGAANAKITLENGKPVVTPADTYEVFLSGASAPRNFIEQLLVNTKVPKANRLCKANTTIYKFADSTSNNQTAYLCELNAQNPALSGLAAGKTNLMVYKRDAGGSAQGVSPIIANAAISFLKVEPSICSVPQSVSGLTVSLCSYTEGNPAQSQDVIPDFGVSDVDPIQFSGSNTPAGFNPVTIRDLKKLEVRSAAAQVFGIAVSLKLRNALQAAQFKPSKKCHPSHPQYANNAEKAFCMPTLSSGQIASLFTGKFSSWKQLRVGGSNNLFDNAPNNLKGKDDNADRIHICGRVSGSGTRAQFGIKFLGYPCNNIANPQVDGDFDADTTNNPPEAVNIAQVHNNSSSGDVEECMTDLDSATGAGIGKFNNIYPDVRWTIGYQGAERNSTLSKDYRFIKVDGVEPTLNKVISGRYKDWVELTFQWNKNHSFDTSEKQIVEEIIKEAGNPVVMGVTNAAGTHSWGQSGFLAVPQSFDPQSNGRISNSRPVNPMSHGTPKQDPNACRTPVIYNPKTATSGLQLL